MVITASTDKTCIVVHPHDGLYGASVLSVLLIDLLVLPEFEDLNLAFFVVQRVEVPTIRELDLCAAANLVKAKLRHGDVIRMHRVDADPIWMSNNDIETRGVEGDGLDRVCQLLDDLEGERAWMGSVAPYHESLI